MRNPATSHWINDCLYIGISRRASMNKSGILSQIASQRQPLYVYDHEWRGQRTMFKLNAKGAGVPLSHLPKKALSRAMVPQYRWSKRLAWVLGLILFSIKNSCPNLKGAPKYLNNYLSLILEKLCCNNPFVFLYIFTLTFQFLI